MLALDPVDCQILRLLQGNARIANAEISREIGLAPSATHSRTRKLEERGVVVGYEARLDPKQVGLGLLAFVFIKSVTPIGREFAVAETLASMPEVLEVHHVAGEDGILAKVRARDTASLYDLVLLRIGSIEGVENTRTVITFRTLKETTTVAVAPVGDEA